MSNALMTINYNATARIKILVLRLFCILVAIICFAINISYSAGDTSANFLKIAPGARPAGIGEAFTSIANDASAIYYNCAGLPTIKSKEFLISHNIWFQDINHSFFAIAVPVGSDYLTGSPNKAIGFSATYLGVQGLERRSENTEQSEGSFGAGDFSFSCAYGHTFNDALSFPFSLGTSCKFIRQTIDEYSANAVAFDFGLLSPLNVSNIPLVLGFTVQNIGTPIKFIKEEYPLPLTYKIGFSLSPNAVRGLPLCIAFDVALPNDNDINWRVGTEYSANKLLALRVGYSSQNKITRNALTGGVLGSINDEGISKFTGLMAGFGINMPLNRMLGSSNTLNLDYAFVPFGDLGNTHRISLGLKW